MNDLLDAALDYAGRGWLVMPLRPGTKLPATDHGFKDASTDRSVIRQWWGCWPRANVGIRTGMGTGLIVLDVDPPEGFRSLERLMMATACCREGRWSGLHEMGDTITSLTRAESRCPIRRASWAEASTSAAMVVTSSPRPLW